MSEQSVICQRCEHPVESHITVQDHTNVAGWSIEAIQRGTGCHEEELYEDVYGWKRIGICDCPFSRRDAELNAK